MKDGKYSIRLQTQFGLSMVELMIAIALGVVLLLGLVQIFGGVRASFNAADSRARIQENGRFALEFIRRDTRMAGHFGCRNEFHHFPSTVARALEPPANGALDSGFSNHLVGAGNLSIRDNAPYTTQAHRPIEIYNYAATAPGNATYVIASATPAADGTPANWAGLPDAGLGTISARAVPGSDILVLRYFDESTATVTNSVNIATGDIPLRTVDAADVDLFGLYGLTDCNLASLFQITALPSPTVVRAADGGLNLQRAAGVNWFDTSINELYGRGTMFYRYQFVVYYIGVGVNGPALFRQTLTEAPTTSAAGVQLSAPVEVVEGVEMMQILAGIDTTAPRDDFVNRYVDPGTLTAGAGTATQIDNAFRQVSSLRISLLVRGNPQTFTPRTRNTIVVGDLNVTLPNDGRARQTYDMTIGIRNRLRA